MNSTGMARKVDDLGRIVLPVEMRRMFGIRPGDNLEIRVDGGAILLRKIETRCVFCGGEDGLRPYRDKRVCPACAADIAAGARAPSTAGASASPAAVGVEGLTPAPEGELVHPPLADA